MLENLFLDQSTQGGMSTFIVLGIIFIISYIFMILPQQKKQKQEKIFRNNLKIGDKIVTISGIHGRINEINTDTFVIETSAGKIIFEKNSISRDLTINRYNK